MTKTKRSKSRSATTLVRDEPIRMSQGTVGFDLECLPPDQGAMRPAHVQLALGCHSESLHYLGPRLDRAVSDI
jgi:hypothetical protein